MRSRHPPAAASNTNCRTGRQSNELVRNQDDGAIRHAGDILVPEERNSGRRKHRSLRFPQGLRSFDKVDGDGFEEARHDPQSPERISHQRPAPRPQLDQPDAGRLAHLPPNLSRPQSDQFAENLRYFWRSDEVSALPDRVFLAVIAVLWIVETRLHIIVKRDRAGGGDPRRQFPRQRRCRGLARRDLRHHIAKCFLA